MDNLIDTLLNMSVFGFIGLMIYLYIKDTDADGNAPGPDGPDAGPSP